MHKPEQQQDPGGDAANQAETVLTLQAITETREHPEFTPEQLPALWQQAAEPGGTPINRLRRDRWMHGIDAMYRRCETYPQHAKLAAILSGMPNSAWHETGWIVTQADDLAHQATPAQLQQALAHEQQHPEEWWLASDHVFACATVEQLTGQVIEQLAWQDWFLTYATTPGLRTMDYDLEGARSRRTRHVVEHIQQRLLEGNNNAWTVFLGIVGRGTVIGTAIELANAIEQQNRPSRNRT